MLGCLPRGVFCYLDVVREWVPYSVRDARAKLDRGTSAVE